MKVFKNSQLLDGHTVYCFAAYSHIALCRGQSALCIHNVQRDSNPGWVVVHVSKWLRFWVGSPLRGGISVRPSLVHSHLFPVV